MIHTASLLLLTGLALLTVGCVPVVGGGGTQTTPRATNRRRSHVGSWPLARAASFSIMGERGMWTTIGRRMRASTQGRCPVSFSS